MTFNSLTYEIKNNVAYVTFSTPKTLNSITEERISDLSEVVSLLEENTTINAAAITGTGRAFCVGLDLDLLKRAFDDMEYFESVVRRLSSIILRLERLPIPVVAAVNGYARAGGIEIALGCDLMIIADEAKIGDNHTHVNVMPGAGSTQRLPRRIGMQRAKELIWSAKWLTGKEAVEYGLALKSVPLEDLPKELENILDQLRDKHRAVLSVVKRTLREGDGLSIEDGVELELRNFLQYMGQEPYARDGFWASLAEEADS